MPDLRISVGFVVKPCTFPALYAAFIGSMSAPSMKILTRNVLIAFPRRTLAGRLPFHFVGLEIRVRHDEVPHHRMKRLRVRRDRARVYDWHDNAGVCDLGRVPA